MREGLAAIAAAGLSLCHWQGARCCGQRGSGAKGGHGTQGQERSRTAMGTVGDLETGGAGSNIFQQNGKNPREIREKIGKILNSKLRILKWNLVGC